MKAIVRTQFGYLFYGLVFWFPSLILLAVLATTLGPLENLGRKLLKIVIPSEFLYPGFGLIFLGIVFYLTGILLGRSLMTRLVSKIPILNLFLGKKKGRQTITLERLLNLTPCLFLLSPTCLSYGWVLNEQKVILPNGENGPSLVLIYYPNVPTLITGQVYSVRKEGAIRLGNTSTEIINILLYNISGPEALKCLPWDDENQEEFKKRVASFGLALSVK